MIFCTNTYLDNHTNLFNVKVITLTLNRFVWLSKVDFVFFVSWPKFTELFSSNVTKIVVANAVFHLSTAWSVPEIFAIKVYSCPKSSALLITRKPLHIARWNFARTSISTTSIILFNFKSSAKGQGHMGFWCFSVYVILRLPADST